MKALLDILMHLSPPTLAGIFFGLYLASAFPQILANQNILLLVGGVVVLLLGGKNSWDKLGLMVPQIDLSTVVQPGAERKPQMDTDAHG